MDGFGVADVQIAVGLGREARADAASVFIGVQVVLKDVVDEIGNNHGRGGSTFTHEISPAGSSSRARSMRWRHVSRPSTTSVSNRGGATLRPHTATRTG